MKVTTNGLPNMASLGAQLAQVSAFAGKPELAYSFSIKVMGIKAIKGLLNAKGLANLMAYRELGHSFAAQNARCQFLAHHPNDLYELAEYLQIPEAAYTLFGISKDEFMDLVGFEALCKISAKYAKLHELKGAAAKVTADMPRELHNAYQSIIVETERNIAEAEPIIAATYRVNVERFRNLLSLNRLPQVRMVMEHPRWIWLRQHPLPERLVPKGRNFGKWVINSDNPDEPYRLAGKILPHYAPGRVGTMKFELARRPSGICSFLVYAPYQDRDVFSLVESVAGRNPFWVPDEYCHEADSLSKIFASYMLNVGRLEAAEQWPSSKIEAFLRNEELCRSKGLSQIQVEMLWRLVHSDEPQYQSKDDAFWHVIDGYFITPDSVDLAGNEKEPYLRLMLPRMLCFLFEVESGEKLRAFFEAQRASAATIYQ